MAAPLLLTWAILAMSVMMASAQVLPTNTSSAVESQYTYALEPGNMLPASPLVPLTDKAANGFTNNQLRLGTQLVLTNSDTIQNLTNNIAYISCDSPDYPGNLDAAGILGQAVGSAEALILYSQTSQYCAYNDIPATVQQALLFSMSGANESTALLSNVQKNPPSNMFFATIRQTSSSAQTNGSSSNGQSSQQNPLGPSPSTAVAMIILYSITGIITALFLVIIITGAIRAHRHPDRYGPRDVLGRPRQSRARGLGRAILDTIPIVKFGEREPPKPADVEMGSTSEARNGGEGADAPASTTESDAERVEGRALAQSTEYSEAPRPSIGGGIAPAQPLAATTADTVDPSSPDEGLGCSICTDDFERGQDIRVLPCNHKFHPQCVDPWLLNVSGTCPLCRVDLRPVTSRTSTSLSDFDQSHLAPPLETEATDVAHRRRSTLRDILSFRHRPNASTEERIAALRRLREQQAEGSASAGTSSEDLGSVRRSRRISTRLHDVFSVRTRRGVAENTPAEGPSGNGGLSDQANSSTERRNSSEGARREE